MGGPGILSVFLWAFWLWLCVGFRLCPMSTFMGKVVGLWVRGPPPTMSGGTCLTTRTVAFMVVLEGPRVPCSLPEQRCCSRDVLECRAVSRCGVTHTARPPVATNTQFFQNRQPVIRACCSAKLILV